MKKSSTLLIALIYSFYLFADNFPAGANSAGMAHSTVAVADIWSVYHNQAGLAYLDGFSFAAHYDNTFMLKEFAVKSAAFALNTKTGAFALAYTNYGFSKFNENKFGFAYALKLAKFLSVGFQIDYFLLQQPAYYGNISTVAGEIGLLAKPTKKLSIGAHVFNFWQAKLNEYEDERLPTLFRIGLAYHFTEKVLFTLETEKDLEQKPTFKTGLDYNLIAKFYLRTGLYINSTDYSYSFGVGYKYKGVALDMAVNKHPVLDYNTAISLLVNFKKK